MNSRWLIALAVISTLTTTTWCSAQSAAESSFFDNVCQYATLYDSEGNRFMQKLALTGRIQLDTAWIDADDAALEVFTDLLWRRFRFGSKWQWKAGVFSSDGSDGLSRFEAGYFTLLSLGRDYASAGALDSGLVRVDWVYNDEGPEADTPEFSQMFSLVTQWQLGSWGLSSDLSAGQGYGGQSDLWGAVLMPFYNVSPHIQTVFRYTYLSSNGPNGVSLTRYENKVVKGLGDEYNELYAGLNVFFYGHKLKWQTGLQFARMKTNLPMVATSRAGA